MVRERGESSGCGYNAVAPAVYLALSTALVLLPAALVVVPVGVVTNAIANFTVLVVEARAKSCC